MATFDQIAADNPLGVLTGPEVLLASRAGAVGATTPAAIASFVVNNAVVTTSSYEQSLATIAGLANAALSPATISQAEITATGGAQQVLMSDIALFVANSGAGGTGSVLSVAGKAGSVTLFPTDITNFASQATVTSNAVGLGTATAVARSLDARASDWFNFKDLGAALDGTTADRARLQAVRSALTNSSTIIIPTGLWPSGFTLNNTNNNLAMLLSLGSLDYGAGSYPGSNSVGAINSGGVPVVGPADGDLLVGYRNGSLVFSQSDTLTANEHSAIVINYVNNRSVTHGGGNNIAFLTNATVAPNALGNVYGHSIVLNSHGNHGYGTDDVALNIAMGQFASNWGWGIVSLVGDYSGLGTGRTPGAALYNAEFDMYGSGPEQASFYYNVDAGTRTMQLYRFQEWTGGSSWQANHSYAVGAIIENCSVAGVAYIMQCTQAGTSGATHPTWGIGTNGDNTVVWISTVTMAPQFAYCIRVLTDNNCAVGTVITGDATIVNAVLDLSNFNVQNPNGQGAGIRLAPGMRIDFSGNQTAASQSLRTLAYNTYSNAFEYTAFSTYNSNNANNVVFSAYDGLGFAAHHIFTAAWGQSGNIGLLSTKASGYLYGLTVARNYTNSSDEVDFIGNGFNFYPFTSATGGTGNITSPALQITSAGVQFALTPNGSNFVALSDMAANGYSVAYNGATGDGTTVDAAAIEAAGTAAAAAGHTKLFFPQGTYLGDNSLSLANSSAQVWVGPGHIIYGSATLRQVAAEHLPTPEMFASTITAAMLPQFMSAAAPAVAIIGDSIFNLNSDLPTPDSSPWFTLIQQLITQNPTRSLSFFNFTVGGQAWGNINGKPAYGIPNQWYTDVTKNWLYYPQQFAPDLFFMYSGGNDGYNFSAVAFTAAIATVKSWSKVPDVVLGITYKPSLETAGGANAIGNQNGIDFTTMYQRSWALYNNVPILDFHRWFVMCRDGYDPRNITLTRITPGGGSITAFPSPNVSGDANDRWYFPTDIVNDNGVVPGLCTDFYINFTVNQAFTALDGTTGWSVQMSTAPGGSGLAPLTVVNPAGGNWADNGFYVDCSGTNLAYYWRDGINTYGPFTTTIPVPAAPTSWGVSLKDNILIVTYNATFVETVRPYAQIGNDVNTLCRIQIIRWGGPFQPFIHGISSSQTMVINNLACGNSSAITNNNRRFRPSVTNLELYQYTAQAGGSDSFHMNAYGWSKIIYPVIKATNFAPAVNINSPKGVLGINAAGVAAAPGAIAVGGSGGPSWSTGSAVPTLTAPQGSLYSRIGGSAGTTLYVSQGGGTWNAVAGV